MPNEQKSNLFCDPLPKCKTLIALLTYLSIFMLFATMLAMGILNQFVVSSSPLRGMERQRSGRLCSEKMA